MDQKSEEAFRAYVTARSGALLRLAVGLAGERAKGEDLLQSALTRAFVSWSRVQKADDPDAYVRRIVVTTHLSQGRRKRVRELLSFQVHESLGHEATPGVDDRQALLPALRRLGPKQRAVVVLRYYEDRPDEEIAALLGCSTATVRSQAMRALSHLRELPELASYRPVSTSWELP